MSAALAGYRRNGGFSGLLAGSAMLVGLTGICLLAVYRTPSPSITSFVALAGFAVVGGWMFLSERYELTLAVLLLYLLLLDGFLKLKTGSQFATLGRDILFYAIVSGAVARWLQRRQSVPLPPLSGWVLAFTLIIAVSALNPGSYPALHALASMRPHLEFVPMFFFGYFIFRDRHRIRVFLLLLLVCAAANGVVNTVQFNMDPDQLASWGPGYSKFIKGGTDGIAGRTFAGDDGKERVRPFGLGADAGSGGLIALLAVPAAFALISTGRKRPAQTVGVVILTAGMVTAIVTSQGRGIVIAAFIMVFAYALLTVTARRLVPALAGIVIGGLVVALLVSAVTSKTGAGALRYDSIAPDKLLETTGSNRGGTLLLVPEYMQRFPLGHGLGSGGPATGFGRDTSDPNAEQLSAESEFSFMVIEAGILGVLVITGFVLKLLWTAITRIRRIVDDELRALLAAAVAPLFGIFGLFIGGAPTAGSPMGPYLWFMAGAMSYWLLSGRSAETMGTPMPRHAARLRPAVKLPLRSAPKQLESRREPVPRPNDGVWTDPPTVSQLDAMFSWDGGPILGRRRDPGTDAGSAADD